ncbi:MATE family efflux transporter [Peptostreptococcus faecalis]|uniref:MATE family efflux transporter n=1 Tax=Peptostreptococcus faecalis TaxID=2045015 RepID=UPI001FA8F8E8|nr:MATE family efflux transporter [Peptostreptococcus faecalis]
MINVIAMLGISCCILADTFFISKGLGADGVAALNLAIPIFSLINASGLMLGMGGATKYSIYNAQNEKELSKKIFTNTIYIAATVSVVFILLGLLFSNNISYLLGANAEVFDMTNIYLKVALLFAPAFIMNHIFMCFIRNDGNPKLAMTASLIGNFSNIFLDWLFIFPFGMGMFGAIFATGLAPVISILFMLSQTIKSSKKIEFEVVNPQRSMIRNVFTLGFPSFVVEISSGIVIVIFNILILNISGNVGVAAYGIIANLSLVVIAVFTGIAQGMQPITSKAYGEGKIHISKYIFKKAVIISGIAALGIYIVVFLFADSIASVFNNENNQVLQGIATNGLRLYFIGILFAGINIVMSMFCTSIEKIIPAHVITLLRGIIVIVPSAIILSKLLGLNGVWIAFPTTEIIVLVIGICMYKKIIAKNKNLS